MTSISRWRGGLDYRTMTDMNANPTVTFWGAARTVTGSMHLVEAAGRSLLLDCGLFQGRRSEARERNSSFPFDPKKIDAVVLSHAHIDHCGNLPNLVKHGFDGPIYGTPATCDLSAVMLADSAKIQEEDAEYFNRKRDRAEPPVEPLYTRADARRVARRCHAVPYGRPVDIADGVRLTFTDAGHLLGSALVHLQMGGRSLTFTGDVGRRGLPILRDPDPIPPADLVLSESTYGGRRHPPVEELAERLGAVIGRTVARGGKVLIPAFSVGRTQTVVYYLHQLMNDGRLPELPIYVDSPLASDATEVFRLHPECFDDQTADLLEESPDLFGQKRVHYVRKAEESMALNGRRDPCVIIASSGMCEAGRILHHLKHNIEDPRTTVIIIGFQAPHTLGHRLVERLPEVRIFGRPYRLRAEVAVLNGFSSHADHDDLMRAFMPLKGRTKRICLVHGEPEAAEALATGLRDGGFGDVVVPDRGATVEVSV